MLTLLRKGTIQRVRTYQNRIVQDEVPSLNAIVFDASGTLTNVRLMEYYADLSYTSVQKDIHILPPIKTTDFVNHTLVVNMAGFNPKANDPITRSQKLAIANLIDTIVDYNRAYHIGREVPFYFIMGSDQAQLPGQNGEDMFAMLYDWIEHRFTEYKGKIYWIGTGRSGNGNAMEHNYQQLRLFFSKHTTPHFRLQDWWETIPPQWLRTDGSGAIKFPRINAVQRVILRRIAAHIHDPPIWVHSQPDGPVRGARRQQRTQQWNAARRQADPKPFPTVSFTELLYSSPLHNPEGLPYEDFHALTNGF